MSKSKQFLCDASEEDHGGIEASMRCPECGTLYCDACASLCDYECGCIEPPQLEDLT